MSGKMRSVVARCEAVTGCNLHHTIPILQGNTPSLRLQVMSVLKTKLTHQCQSLASSLPAVSLQVVWRHIGDVEDDFLGAVLSCEFKS